MEEVKMAENKPYELNVTEAGNLLRAWVKSEIDVRQLHIDGHEGNGPIILQESREHMKEDIQRLKLLRTILDHVELVQT